MLIFGIVGFFIPYVYTVVPVYETDQCWHWLRTFSEGIFEYEDIKCTLVEINKLAFIFWNWLELILLIGLYMLIDSIKDEMNI